MIDNIKDLIEIDEREVLRYLQYKNQDIEYNLSEKIKQCIKKTREIINPRFIFRKYKIKKLKLSDVKSEVYLEGANLTLKSDDIHNLLLECDECILMSATLGLEIEREIRKLTYTDLTKGIIVDACATAAIEEVCDIVQNNIAKKLLKEDKYITYRYSPGYGDLPIEKNVDINNLLNSQKEIGLTVTNSGIMIPRKSVVALIGVSHKGITNTKKSCENCSNRHNCDYKKEGNSCEN
ncbi:vitamin B12 dependent-methionine synthase activation domain-containing protein [Terrisporobacter vanillatitrophus]|uniref:vitamin B12 dependent-methionine synthase activation domain-containing protein n=1 Tax=Terrisporobacter vanillatitrophus TaxID=3058402 RepID=UPI0033665048